MLLTVCAVILLVYTIRNYMSIVRNQNEPNVKVTRVLETENRDGEAVVKLTAVTEKEDTGVAVVKTEQEPETIPETEPVQSETGNWMEIIFGPVKTGVSSQIQISGLTSSEKEMAGFKEASFVKAVSLFLSEKGIRTSRIYFEGQIDCSSEKAVVYSASLDGYKDKKLTIIFYPDYPGQFLITLDEIKTEQPAAQTETQAQTEAPQPIVQPQPETRAAETERSYDATKLSIYSIPKELLNYIDNQYMLQYSLYDYLYKNGYDQIDGATITGYEIDGDTRTAVINFVLGSGKTVTGTYSKDNSSYSFR